MYLVILGLDLKALLVRALWSIVLSRRSWVQIPLGSKVSLYRGITSKFPFKGKQPRKVGGGDGGGGGLLGYLLTF